ncbi:hypothetical protein EDD85DRAFT_950466 [Armillaria nabsnona]|nr:hypothetical protein EDD85DRAFT_950466 [Armillaria nabsnona]
MAPRTRARLAEFASATDDDAQPSIDPTSDAGSSSRGPGEAQRSHVNEASRQPDMAATTTMKLSFTVKQSADHERLFEGEVVDRQGSDRNGSYSLEYPDLETTIGAPTATGTGRRVTPLPGHLESGHTGPSPNKKPPFTSSSLFGEGYVPIAEFQPNTAFSSIRGSHLGKKTPGPTGKSWRQRSPEKEASIPLPQSPDTQQHNPLVDPPANKKSATGSRPPSTVEDIMDNYAAADDETSDRDNSTENEVLTAKSEEENRVAVRAMIQEFLLDENRVKESMREQLSMLSANQRIIVQETAHIRTASVFTCLGFVDVNKTSDEYIHQYNVEMITLIMGREIRWANEEEESGGEALTMPPPIMSFKRQQALIARRLGKTSMNGTEKKIDEDIPLPRKSKSKPVKVETPNEKVPEVKAAAQSEQMRCPVNTDDGDSAAIVPPHTINIDELRNRVVLQRIRLSQMRDGMEPTVTDQGIVFDNNNNAWLRPDQADSSTIQPTLSQTITNNGDRDDKNRRREKEGNPDEPPSNGDGSDDEPDKKPHRDPFMPRMDARDTSATPSRSIEAKMRYAERKCQQIVEFMRHNLGTKLMIPDGLKGARLDVKSMKKYDGTSSREVYWEWLRSLVFAYRASQLGGPDRDEERVLILDLLLEGKAKAWFHLRLERSDLPYPTFIEALIEMYNRFIHESALQDARRAFR